MHTTATSHAAIFWPMLALMLWTLLMLLQVPIHRFRAYFAGRVGRYDFQYGEADTVPTDVILPNRVFMNLLEVPVIFYFICILFYLTGQVSHTILMLAWLYFGLRIAHSLIYLTYNHVVHRFAVFATSNVVVLVLLLMFGAKLAVIS